MKMHVGGLTKITSRQDLADVRRKGFHALKFDGEVKAGKKQTQQERRQHQQELDEYANQKKRTWSGPRPGKKTLAAALLAEAAEGVAAAAADSCTALATRAEHFCDEGYSTWTLLKVMMLGVAIGMMLMAACPWWTKGDLKRGEKRSVKTQSQTRYAWDRSEPRFVPLAERDQGVWLDFWSDEVQSRGVAGERMRE